MELNSRLIILRDAGQITEESYYGILKVIEMFERDFKIKLTEENGAMLITHLAVAIERIKKGESVGPINEFIYEEIKNSPNFNKGQELLKAMETELQVEIPEVEQAYFMMHICALFENLAQ